MNKQERKFSVMRKDIEDPLLFVGYIQSLFFKKNDGRFDNIWFRHPKEIKSKFSPHAEKKPPAALCVGGDTLIYILPMKFAVQENGNFRFRFNVSKTDSFSPMGELEEMIYLSDFWTTESETWGHKFEHPTWIGTKKYKGENIYFAVRLDGKKIFSKNGFIG